MDKREREIDRWLKWCDRERRKHRVMTAGEYDAWRRGGDAISSSGETNAFPGGLTIIFGPSIIGKTE